MIVVVPRGVKAVNANEIMCLRATRVDLATGGGLGNARPMRFLPCRLLLPLALALPGTAFATEPGSSVATTPSATIAPDPLAPRSEVEASLHALVAPLRRRHVVRNEAGRFDVWLVSDLGFEQVSKALHGAVGSKRPLGDGMRLEQVTWVEPDRSYRVEGAGGGRTLRLRLTRHLKGAMVECEDLGDAADAPRWTPPWRTLPLLLWHGPAK